LFFSLSVSVAQSQDRQGQRMQTPVTLRDALVSQGSARSLTLASMVDPDASANDRARLLQSARALAPADPLVNWLIANNDDDSVHAAVARDTLLRDEPENGATQLLVLKSVNPDDAEAVDSALGRLAAARYFDDHLGDVVVAWLDQLRAHPEQLSDPPRPGQEEFDKPARELVQAFAYAAAVAMPSYRYLGKACSVERTASSPTRRANCTKSGNLIASRAHSLSSRSLGLAILRALESPGFDEQELAYRYLRTESDRLILRSFTDPRQSAQLKADWRETRSEAEVLERLLRREGKALSPPSEWIEPADPFSSVDDSSAGKP
jgi:hypothetical protein